MRLIYSFFFILLLVPRSYTQQTDQLSEILSDFYAYTELPREVVYVHLNKSVFIKGEEVGFSAYVMDKDNKRPSLETTNLYCVLADSNDRMIKSQLIRITNGTGNGIIELDSLFQTGKYRFKAYTNWMRNFSEPNAFEQELTVIDPETDSEINRKSVVFEPDAQFLPEGGHAVAGLTSVYGAIIKDNDGYGLPGITGEIVDDSGKLQTQFKLNEYGIGRFQLRPIEGMRYFARFSYNNKDYKVALPKVEIEGVTVKLTDLQSRVGLNFEASFSNSTNLKGPYYLTVHNGDSIKALDISFTEQGSLIKIFPKEDLFKGINVFTLFNSEKQPILERLYFNDKALHFREAGQTDLANRKDSILVSIQSEFVDPNKLQSLSISVLPSETISYKTQHNLASYTLLRPYLRGSVQDAAYYFQNPSPKTKFELDNLLLTQGWSSYDWTAIWTKPPSYLFDFEKGISFTVDLNNRKSDEFYIFPTANNSSQILKLNPGEDQFSLDGYFPLQDEKIGLTEISKNGMSKPPGAYVRFKPSRIPDFAGKPSLLLPNRLGRVFEEVDIDPISFENIDKLQQLEEVVITSTEKNSRIEKIRNRSNGNVDYFETNDPRRNQFLNNYLSGRGFLVTEQSGDVSIISRNPNSPNNNRPLVYLDGVLLNDLSVLYRFQLDLVDYIEINKSGVGSGLFGGGGVIKIFTDPMRRNIKGYSKSYNDFDVPLSFGVPKKYYTPKYASYSSDFFRSFGTIDWFPKLQYDQGGTLRILMKDYRQETITLFIEGIVNDNEFISQQIQVRPGVYTD